MNTAGLVSNPGRFLMRCLLVSLIAAQAAGAGCAVREGPVFEKEGKFFGRPDGVFKGKWSDYYLRGLSYADGGYWQHAAADFIQALRQRQTDQRRARTYGIHLIDYFPNREMGIACFNLNRFDDAVRYLEKSLDSAETARAKFYLDRARRQRLKRNQLDKLPPTITVAFPPSGYTTNRLSLRIEGEALDDYFVAGITVNSDKIGLAPAQKRIAFSRDIPLAPGQNTLTLKAVDLTGKSCAPLNLSVYADTAGPAVLIDGTVQSDGTIEVIGSAFDDRGVAKVEIGGRTIQVTADRFIRFHSFLDLPAPGEPARAPFRISDHAGNQTSGMIDLPARLNAAALPRVAFNSPVGRLPVMQLPRKPTPGAPPSPAHRSIFVRDFEDNQTVYTESFYLEGKVIAPEGIRELSVNGRPVFAAEGDSAASRFLNELLHSRKKTLSFSCLIPLEPGPNDIIINLSDRSDRLSSKVFRVIRKVPSAKQLSSRLTLSIYPFSLHADRDEFIRDYVHSRLVHAFVSQQRFQVLERKELSRVLHEQRLSQESIFDPQTALQLGRLMASESILVGEVFKKDKSVEIMARLIDTETALVIAEKDAYWEQGAQNGLSEVLQGLALKFKQHLPICEGVILSRKAEKVIFNLGGRDSIVRGMRFIAFKEADPVRGSDGGRLLGTDTQLIGLISASEIKNNFSVGRVLKTFTPEQPESGHRIISK